MLFLTGLQSALFGPVKYSILPQVLRPEELTGGNGLIEMITSISILLGMITGIVLLHGRAIGRHLCRGRGRALAITGHLVSRAIPRAEAAAPDAEDQLDPGRGIAGGAAPGPQAARGAQRRSSAFPGSGSSAPC